jgi:HK97 family phage prohead protease
MTIEYRSSTEAWPELDMEVRAEGDGLSFRGYAAVFDSPSEDLGGFRETIKPTAFTRSLKAATGKRDIKMFLNHNSDIVLASTRAKTLTLSVDARGLLAEARLPAGAWGQPVAEAIQRGDISAMSFGFTVPKGGDAWDTAHTQRTLHEVSLFEVSPVTGWPAYGATSASVRHLVDAIDWTDEESARHFIDLIPQEQRDMVARALNLDKPTPFIAPDVADRLARLRQLEAA